MNRASDPLDDDIQLLNDAELATMDGYHTDEIRRGFKALADRLALRSAQVRRITNACDDIRPDPELRGAISVAVLRDLLDGRTP